jgi:Fe-S-cluster containining protein
MASKTHQPNGTIAEDLCLACGICCDGTLFADVKLQAGDDSGYLRAVGLPIVVPNAGPGRPSAQGSLGKFAQPCRAFQGCQCRIYEDRPKHCRDFECVLLKSVKSGKTEGAAAFNIIRVARERAQKVERLLLELGDQHENLALSQRFRRTMKRLERSKLDEETADRYGRLTLAVHDLNVLLSRAFYPGVS